MSSFGDTVSTLVTVGVLGFVGLRLVAGLRASAAGPGRRLVAEVWRGVRWRHVWPVVPVLAVIVGTAGILVRVPPLDWGWWTALGGQGNPVTGTTDRTIGTVWEWLIPLVFVVMLAPALPLFAHAEERAFRSGAEGWTTTRRALKCVQFGLVHALIGIPVGVALALSVGGAYFMAVYLRAVRAGADRYAATLESTRAHTVYNVFVVGVLAIYALLVAFGA